MCDAFIYFPRSFSKEREKRFPLPLDRTLLHIQEISCEVFYSKEFSTTSSPIPTSLTYNTVHFVLYCSTFRVLYRNTQPSSLSLSLSLSLSCSLLLSPLSPPSIIFCEQLFPSGEEGEGEGGRGNQRRRKQQHQVNGTGDSVL